MAAIHQQFFEFGSSPLQNFHWDDLPHTFASRLVMAGADLYTVKKLLGHHDMKMTNVMRISHPII